MAFVERGGVRWNDGLYDAPPGVFFELARRLLAEGGDVVVWVATAVPLVEELVARAVVWRSDAVHATGRPSACHENAALGAAESGLRIGTGWALSDDGLWRAHSWNVRDDGVVVETTVARTGYVGIVLDDVETVLFCVNEDAGDALVASDPVRWLPVIDRIAQVPDAVGDSDGSGWQLARLLRDA